MSPHVRSDLFPGDAGRSIARYLPIIRSAGKLFHIRQPVTSCICADIPSNALVAAHRVAW